jgi:hypothetical protein
MRAGRPLQRRAAWEGLARDAFRYGGWLVDSFFPTLAPAECSQRLFVFALQQRPRRGDAAL